MKRKIEKKEDDKEKVSKENRKKNTGNEGKKFEKDFQDSFKKIRIFIYRLRDAGGFGAVSTTNRFTITNVADFIAFNKYNSESNHKILLLECKSTQGASLPFTNFKSHQISDLIQYQEEFEETGSYVIINFRKVDETYIVPIEVIRKAYEEAQIGGRKSIPIEFCKEHGLLIEQSRKRVRYTYNIEKMLKELN